MRKRLILWLAVALFAFTGCNDRENSVTIYTSVDRNYSELVFSDFEEKTGIKVLAVYDTEASKTTGMVNRLVEEMNNPVADVFWNGEFAQTIVLKEKGVLKPYVSEAAERIPNKFRDPDGYWTAFGGRARCILVNTEILAEADYPTGFLDFVSDKYDPSMIGIAYPLFGTTATHSAAIFAVRGERDAEAFYQSLFDRGIHVVSGNGAVRDLVADGQLAFGFTDTDDALGAVRQGKPVKIIIPDQEEGAEGTLIVPNTVAMIEGGQSEEHAKAFIDYLLNEKTEDYLMEIGWIQVSAGSDDNLEELGMDGVIKTMDISLESVYEKIEVTKTTLQRIFIR